MGLSGFVVVGGFIRLFLCGCFEEEGCDVFGFCLSGCYVCLLRGLRS